MPLTIRPATIGDTDTILRFVRDLAIYEHAEDQVLSTPAHVHRTMFSEGATAHGLICEKDGQAVGFAVYFFNYSTWQGRNGLYLEDLYVDPAHRGSGAGKALLRRLARIALDKDCGRFEWSVLDWNENAIRFYEKMGATVMTEWQICRVTGDKLQAFARPTAGPA